ncbi:MAG: CRISPR-associated protein Csx20 [Desulfobacteraceae bacterium]
MISRTNPNLFLLLNHQFTSEQEEDARVRLQIGSVRRPPSETQPLWGRVPPDLEEIACFLDPFKEWLRREAKVGDLVLIQGDFGACYLMVRFAFDSGLVPVYATTERQATEELLEDGTIRLVHTFKHRRFRQYGR